jgi:hypothetical protein
MCFKLNNVLFGLIARAINLVKVLKRCYKMKVLCALIYCYYEICHTFIDSFFFPKNEIFTKCASSFQVYCRVLFAAEGTFGGGNLRVPNIQPIATTLIY